MLSDPVERAAGPLAGLRVVDAATLVAGPMVATALGEYGAEVIKIEEPRLGDPFRGWGDQKDGVGLVWKSVSRNKQCISLDLRVSEGQQILRDLLAVADVFITNARPSALARWGLAYEQIGTSHPHLVMLHVTGFGRGGPMSDRPSFGTIAEAMSGFAHLTGPADGPPTLPPFMLADGVASMAATAAVLAALYHRDMRDGRGQLVDVSLIEPLARVLEPAILTFDQLGIVPHRNGNRLDSGAPRNTYRTADDRWLAMSSAAPSIAQRVYRAIGRSDLADDPNYVDPALRRNHVDEIDEIVATWVRSKSLVEALDVLAAHDAAAGPVYDAAQLLSDEHFHARGTFVSVPDDDLGAMTVQSRVATMSATPTRVDHLGRDLGADNETVYGRLLGLEKTQLEVLAARGII